jgi:pilus assembly protein CpaC
VFPRAEVELSSLPDGAPTVHFRVYLLEMRRSRFGTLGLSWPASVPGAFQVDLGAIREALSLELAIQALEGEGSVRVLSNPELVVRAPGEAELFAGGEIPVRSTSKFRSDVTWKAYGLTLKLKVTHAAGDRVRLEIATEVSHLNPQVVDDPIPGLQSNRMRTQVDARFGEPLLLSGLLQEGTREQARGLPVLRRLPVLGRLFGSEDYLNERSELVAILVPRSSPPPPPAFARPAPLPSVVPVLEPLSTNEALVRPSVRPRTHWASRHSPTLPFTRSPGGTR